MTFHVRHQNFNAVGCYMGWSVSISTVIKPVIFHAKGSAVNLSQYNTGSSYRVDPEGPVSKGIHCSWRNIVKIVVNCKCMTLFAGGGGGGVGACAVHIEAG